MNQVVCFGSASKDIFFPTNDGFIFETPADLLSQKKIAFELGAKYQIENRFEALGGCAANVAVGLARLGIECGCCAMIGDDDLGRWILEQLKKEKVSTRLIRKGKKCRSDVSAVIVDAKSAERVIFFNRDANEKMEVNAKEVSSKAGWFFVSALNGRWRKNADAILKAISGNKARLAFNPGEKNIKDDVGKILEIMRKTEVLFVNKDEGMEIVFLSDSGASREKINEEKFLLRTLKAFGPRVVVLTDGKRGAWAQDKKQIVYSPPGEKSPLETTGAGDAFTSGFLAAYIKGKKLSDCVKWGTLNSGHAVLFYGAVDGLLEEVKIMKKIKQIKTVNL